MAPKNKGKKMNLDAFLADEATGGSWADEMDSLPTGPSGNPDGGGGLGGSHLSRGGDRGGFGDRGRGDFMDRAPRAEVPMPTAPPYTAYIGNLTFETVEMDIEEFFNGMPTTSVRLVSGPDNKPKGFGYVEFGSLDSLKSALAMTGSDLNGRVVRISVAEAPKGREGRADEDMTWERTGPLAPLAGRSGGGFDRPRQEGFGSSAGGPGGEDVVRDGPIRGGKFVASAAAPERRPGGFERSASGGPGGPGGFDRPRQEGFGPGGPGGEEVVRDGPIRGGKFVASAPAPERVGGFGGDRRASGPADEERTWTRSGPLPPAPRTGGFGAPRTGSFENRTPPSGEGSSPQPQRQRLQLSARSSASPSPSTSPAPSSRPSPFGSAKPIDASSRDAAAEAKLDAENAIVAARVAEAKERRERDPALAAGVVDGGKKGSSPFGDAKPVDTVVAPAADKPAAAVVVKPVEVKEEKAWRKEEVSVEEVTKKVEETTV